MDKRPNDTTLLRLSMLPRNARIAFIHEGIHNLSIRSKYISPWGPFWHEDLRVARTTGIALRNVARCSGGGGPGPIVCQVRLASKTHGGKEQTGWLYKKVKSYRYRFAAWEYMNAEEYRGRKVRQLRATLDTNS
jgi:hypothetical protein